MSDDAAAATAKLPARNMSDSAAYQCGKRQSRTDTAQDF